MPQAVTAECVAAQQDHVDRKDKSADSDAEMFRAALAEPERFVNVVCQNEKKQNRQVHKIPVDILKYQREFALAPISAARFAYGTRWRIGPKRFVIGSAVVITRKTKSA